MKASVSYRELQQLIAEHAQQPISFEFVDEKTVKVNYELNLGFIKKSLGVNLRVLELAGTDLKVRYFGSGMDSLVGSALKLVEDKLPKGLLEEMPDHVLKLHLGSIEQLQPVFERIDVKDINMLTDALELVGDFK